MHEKRFIAGVFFADDKVIWSVIENASKGVYPEFDLLGSEIKDFDSRSTPEGDISEFVSELTQEINKLGGKPHQLAVITAACLGPFIYGEIGEKDYGVLAENTRRPAWNSCELAKDLAASFGNLYDPDVKIRVHTDAEAFAYGEFHVKANNGFFVTKEDPNPIIAKKSLAFLLCDEGVGGAVIKSNATFNGDLHTEIGHMRINRHVDDDIEPSNCGGHIGDCLEGLASLRAIEKRWGFTLDNLLDPDNPLETKYLKILGFYFGQALANITLFYTPSHICVGGRIFDIPELLPWARGYYQAALRNPNNDELYPGYPAQQKPDEFISIIENKNSGVLGCLCLSEIALNNEGKKTHLRSVQ